MIVAKTKETRCDPNYLHWSIKQTYTIEKKNQKKEARMYKEHSEGGTPKKIFTKEIYIYYNQQGEVDTLALSYIESNV